MPSIQNNMVWEPVAIPLTEGLDLNTRARLLEPAKLVKAVNCFFPKKGGPEKRYGNVATVVKDSSMINPAGGIPTNYLYGWGLYSATNTNIQNVNNLSQESAYSDAGPLSLVTTRDNEVLALDGHRLFSKTSSGFCRPSANLTPGGAATPKHFYRPSATSKPIGKTQNSQSFSDLGDNGTIKVLAFVDNSVNLVRIKCFDSVTDTLRFDSLISSVTDPGYLKVVPIGNFIQIFVNDVSSNTLYLTVVKNSDLTLSAPASLGANQLQFDVDKINESYLLVAKRTVGNDIQIGYLNANGGVNSTFLAFGTALGLASVSRLSIAVHPLTFDIGVFYNDSGTSKQRFISYSKTGTLLDAGYNVDSLASVANLSICACYLTSVEGYSIFQTYIGLGATKEVRSTLLNTHTVISGEKTDIGSIYNVNLVGKPFRIGNVPFVWVCRGSTAQTSYLLLDRFLKLVGKMEYSTAIDNSADTWLFSSNILTSSPYKVHGALLYRQRVSDAESVFHEQSTKEYRLDFNPVTSAVSAGRCTYFSGMQLWQYDGEEIVEQGFHFVPESPIITPSIAAGTLAGVYQWRIYPCHKNAKGEEVRGAAIVTSAVNVGIPNNTATITGLTCATLRDNSYFLVFRNNNAGTVWHLVSDRDPQSSNCPKNLQSAATWSFVDTISDTVAESREIDSMQETGFLLPFPSPSCTIVTQGKDRLWVSGGEITPGEVWPSRLYSTNETPSFSPGLAVTVDRDNDDITAIGFIASYAAIFKRKKAYVVLEDGLDNNGVGINFRVDLAVSDVGAISPHVTRITGGIVFQAEPGYRLYTPSGTVVPLGVPVDTLNGECTGIIIDTVNYNVRCYQKTVSLVVDYSSGEFSTWTITPTSVVIAPTGIYSVVGNKLYIETPGIYTDDSKNYEYTIRSAPLGKTQGGHQRIRRVGAVGETDQDYAIDVNIYLDEKLYKSDEFKDVHPIQNTSFWGELTWGAGIWGDAEGGGLVGSFVRDSLWRWVRRLSIQKCSCVSVEIVYNGPDKGPVHSVIMLEVGTRAGLDRIART